MWFCVGSNMTRHAVPDVKQKQQQPCKDVTSGLLSQRFGAVYKKIKADVAHFCAYIYKQMIK